MCNKVKFVYLEMYYSCLYVYYFYLANNRDEQKNGQLMGATIEVGGLGILVSQDIVCSQ